MSTAETRAQRINENCDIIWGADSDYIIDAETDDYEWYLCFVKKVVGGYPGDILMMSLRAGGTLRGVNWIAC
ncbi:hypothetical protein K402DRAFT_394348 [Aulographum hederae CBS 113979]|uniref:Uncharacterized protein n=1 Tax=Aulographum hederae CBS 113979 TaxID=1176131 RepID=A0A6G1GXP9_9PEZI|nr:hypothetical protein K402DRAFT_394348 [Aulographum hederae CBS 113979]